MTPAVSVIVPTFRREQAVVEAVASALGQQRVSVDVVVVDDSPEGSGRAGVERIRDPRVKYTKRDSPSGGSPAPGRNEGARSALGEYLYFLDDDDQLLPGALEALAAGLSSAPEVGVATGCVVAHGRDPEIVRVNDAWSRASARLAHRTAHSRLLGTAASLFGPSFTLSCLIRREYFQALGGYDPRYTPYEDVEFWTRAIRTYGHVAVDFPMLYRRTGEKSLTQNADREMTLRKYKAIYRTYIRQHGLAEFAFLWTAARLFRLRSAPS